MTLETPLTDLKGIGPALATKYAQLGLANVGQLLEHYPRRYEDYSTLVPIARIKPGPVSIRATIGQVKGRYVRRGMHITEAIASDDTGSVRLIWFNQPYREGSLKKGEDYYISGLFELRHQRLSIMSPSTELVSDFPLNTARIIPVYRETKGLTSRQIRAAVAQAIDAIDAAADPLPRWLADEHRLVSHAAAVRTMHFPDSQDDLETARRRLGFEEVFELSLAALMNKYDLMSEHAPPVPFAEEVAREFVRHLPFQLTDAQRGAIWQIYQDMERERPMNRLVEGDVGSGKTVVAAMAAMMVLHHGHQVAFMAPTELLARQHAETLHRLLEPMGYADQLGLLVGGMSTSAKKQMHAQIAAGRVRFIVGTHALLQDPVDMHDLELIIIDEQHRFGVDQRKTLQAKAGHMPHVLNLTATPIPRSLALTLYGELDISVIAAKPVGRKPIITEIASPNSRKQLYARITEELEAGRQMFVVCPIISESGVLEVSSAEATYDTLRTRDFKRWRIGLLHGKMKPADKNAVMQDFVDHKLDILVATTVIEVGVDVPNATIMLIEGAERFGLAQAHQLRGRVGRSDHQGYCFLMMSDSSAPNRRLRALESSSDGFKLAELDLQLRGPGAIYGTMQHGQLDLRVARLTDVELIAEGRQSAQEFIDRQENLVQYPYLYQRVSRLRAVTNLN